MGAFISASRMPVDTNSSQTGPGSRSRPPVIGVGASAGGIRALQELFGELPPDLGAAFVVIVHLDPSHASDLSRILAKHTPMRVVQVEGRTRLEADTVYVIPPDRELSISDGLISVTTFDRPRGQRAPVDTFFRSLAEQHGDGFAVVLSGGGSDGAIGVRSIKEKGGLILVQDPEEAEFASMPRSAIASGADFVLPVRELAAQLVALVRNKVNVELDGPSSDSSDVLQRILGYLRVKTGQDFSRYKRPTLLRRIARRMQVAPTETLHGYLNYMRQHPEEAQALFKDLLISVTSFFRDPGAFKALSTLVLPRLFEQEHPDGIRVWVPACATGEEAYSIAILLLDEAARRKLNIDVQVFASDLDPDALALAREGRYPAAIGADVSEEHLARYFDKEDDFYRIRREVRDRIVFALHSVIKDPPFSRMDLISCRNLLVYFDQDVQQLTCSNFHYALVPGGFLFLGPAENADSPAGLFTLLDREARIYRANERPRDRAPLVLRDFTPRHIPTAPAGYRPSRAPRQSDGHLHVRALESMAPPSLLVDAGHRVVNLSESAGRYLLHPSGPLTSDAAEIVRPELKSELESALQRAFERKERSLSPPVPVQFNGDYHSVIVQVAPVSREGATSALVLFIEGGPVEPQPSDLTPAPPGAAVDQLRNTLTATRGQLRTTREQYERAIEELRAANEELQSINEEYRSTAEELETSKEELQSINEELQTVNHELTLKLDQVSRAHSDLQNLITATDVGTLFLDPNLRIKLFTPRVKHIFNIASGDEDRFVTDFTHQLEYDDIVADAQRVLAALIPVERTVRATGDRWFLVRLRPYRTVEDKIDGVVATFVDITERRRSDLAWEARQEMLLRELSHRVKNSLAVVQAITRLSLSDRRDSEDAVAVLEARLMALAKSHDLLIRTDWQGASLEALVREQVGPYAGDSRLQLRGIPTILPPELATPVGLLLHELATNAAKHGAWREPGGRVELGWQQRDSSDGPSWLELTWSEHGGPAPRSERQGAGTKLIKNCIPGSEVRFEFRLEGLRCAFAIPLSKTGPRDAS